MSVLERFASPLRSRDASVRVKAVQKHPPEDTDTLAGLARSDPDPRVRKEAVRRLEAPRVLLELIDTAGDDTARRLARSRGEALLVKIAADDRDLAESRRALQLIAPARGIAEVASRARFEAVREEALERLIALPPDSPERDPALSTVAGRAAEPRTRSRALDAIGSPAGLLQLAVSTEDRESAQAAVRRLEDPELLLAAASNASSKSVRRLARRRAEERLPPDHPERVRAREKALAALLERLAEADPATPGASRAVLEEADAVAATGPVAAELVLRLDEARAGLEGGPGGEGAARLLVPDPDGPEAEPVSAPPAAPPADLPPPVEEILTRLEDAEATPGMAEVDAAERECRQFLEGLTLAERDRARLRAALQGARSRALERKRSRIRDFEVAELADHAVALAKSLAGDSPAPDRVHARRELARLVRRFEGLEPPDGRDGERFRAAAQQAEAALDKAETAQQAHLRQSQERIDALEKRLTALEASEAVPLEEGEAALRELGSLRNTASLWRLAGSERQARFQRIQAALMPRLREAREIREWRHWSNLEEQADLIRRARALIELDDLSRADRELAGLERAWHKARHTGRSRGQELWEEWAKVREQVLERIAPLREEAERNLSAKLEKLRALAERAEEIAGAADPRLAAEMRSLMPEWRERAKGVGKPSERLWKRFREANDRYFKELKTLRKRRHEEFAANIPIRDELIGRARALGEDSDGESVRRAVRELMQAWKEAPPVPRRDSERLWEAFRGACDAARDRFRKAPAEPEATRDAPSGPPASEGDPELRARITELQARPPGERRDDAVALWDEFRRRRRSPPPNGVSREAEEAMLDCLRETFEADPGMFAGTRLDQEELASRLAGLLEQLEALAPSRQTVAADAGAVGMAEHLRRTLQAGRAADRGAALREDASKARQLVERARAAGPALGDPASGTLRRIEGLARKVIARAPAADDREEGPRRRPRPPRRRRPPGR